MPTLTVPRNQDFNLDRTLSCGQVFRWEREGEGWQGIVDGTILRIRQDGKKLQFSGTDRARITRYFSLDVDLTAILQDITERDPAFREVIRSCRGLRIVRQDPWECTLSYLIATYSNIPTIRRRIETLARVWGTSIVQGGRSYYAFPAPEAFTTICRDSLEDCRLGYRGPYLLQTACRLASDPDWAERIYRAPYEEGRRALMDLRGIGPKAADCILLFAFGRYEAFPVDVWIQRIMQERFPELQGKGNEVIRRFGQDHFGPYAGYAQEYLYAARQVPTSQASR